MVDLSAIDWRIDQVIKAAIVLVVVIAVTGAGLFLALHTPDRDPVGQFTVNSGTQRADSREAASPPSMPHDSIETSPFPLESPHESLLRKARDQEESRRHDDWIEESLAGSFRSSSWVRGYMTAAEADRLREFCRVSPAERELVASILRAAEADVRNWLNELSRLCDVELKRREKEGQFLRLEVGRAESFAEVTRLGLDALVGGNPRSGLFAYQTMTGHTWNQSGEQVSHTLFFDLRSGTNQRWLEERRAVVGRVDERISRLLDELSALHSSR